MDAPDFLKNQPQQKRSLSKYEAIMKSAGKLFAEMGYLDATINDIAAHAGVSVGAVYHFFPDKETIAKAIAYEYSLEAQDKYQEIAASMAAGNEVEVVIKQLVQAAAELQKKHAAYYAISETWNPGDANPLTHGTRNALNKQFKQVIEANGYGVNEGDLLLTMDFTMETMRHFLHRAPKSGKKRTQYVEELERMMVAYMGYRLVPK